MAAETSSSESSFILNSNLVNKELCSDDDSESDFTISEPYDSHVHLSSSIITAKNLFSFLQTLREGNTSHIFGMTRSRSFYHYAIKQSCGKTYWL